MKELFDTHAHYDDRAFDGDREELLKSLPGSGVTRVVNIGSSIAACRKTLALMDRYDFVYGALGVHPEEAAELDAGCMRWLEEKCRHKKCVAIGEIGLDYYWDEPDREIQKEWFVRQLDLARRVGLPVVLHSRDAAKDTEDILRAEKVREIGGVMHCYSYSRESAKAFLDMGLYFGIGGVLTFKNARKLVEAVEYIPMDRIVLETDCPYLAPVPNRGKRNSSLNLPYVVSVLARIKGISEEEVRLAAWENACRLYRMN